MLYIKVPDMNDSYSTLSIDDKVYLLRFTYNERYDYWSFGLYDNKRTPLIAMTDGIFGCISDSEKVGRYAFRDKTAEFVYIPNKETE